MKTFVYRLYPSKSQAKSLRIIRAVCRRFYNQCLAERKTTYEETGVGVTKKQQLRQVKTFKQDQDVRVHSHILQVVAADLQKAFDAFFRRCEAGEKPGYPRFKSSNRFRSFGLKEYKNGFKIDGRKLKIYGVGRVSVRWHRTLTGQIKTLRVVEKCGRWFAHFTCKSEGASLLKTGQTIGVDMGLSAFLTTSDGLKIENPKWYQVEQKRLRVLQRSVSRKKKGSNRRKKDVRRLQRQYAKIKNRRVDFLHKLSTKFIREFDVIALEDLQVDNMVKDPRFAKGILDASWSTFRQMLTYKAESAGRLVEFVNPAYTSQDCSGCGARHQLKLSQQSMKCDCGLDLDRDHNAAINILQRTGRVHRASSLPRGGLAREAAGF